MSDPLIKKVEDVVTGHDEPVGQRHPQATWSFIWLIYPLALIASACALLLFLGVGR